MQHLLGERDWAHLVDFDRGDGSHRVRVLRAAVAVAVRVASALAQDAEDVAHAGQRPHQPGPAVALQIRSERRPLAGILGGGRAPFRCRAVRRGARVIRDFGKVFVGAVGAPRVVVVVMVSVVVVVGVRSVPRLLYSAGDRVHGGRRLVGAVGAVGNS